MRQIWVWQIFLFNSLLEPLSWGAASNSESWVRGVSCLVHLPLSLHDQREAMLCSQTCPIASWLCCEHHKAVIPGLPVLPHTHPDRNGQSCCLISSREEGGVGSPPPLLGSALGRGSGNLPLAGQNTKCFPKPPAHRASGTNRFPHPQNNSSQGFEIARSFICISFSSLQTSPGLRVCLPHRTCFPDGFQRLPPSLQNTNTHNKTQIQVPGTILWVRLPQFL